MKLPDRFLSPAEAARRLGVSPKALRLYERAGLVEPGRTAAGWRAYGPTEMARAAEVAALRALGLSLAETARVLAGDCGGLEPALAAHQAQLEAQAKDLAGAIAKVRDLRGGLARGEAPGLAELARLRRPAAAPCVAFDLPWPWGGERFELCEIEPITFIVGSLGSGKTRLARRLAEALPAAGFLGPERLEEDETALKARLAADPESQARVEAALAWLSEEGAERSAALVVLLCAVEDGGSGALVVDMVEDGLGEATQEALIAWLRRRGPGARPLFLMTRSSAVLDPSEVGPGEAIILCPANHSPPVLVTPRPGAPGFEALTMCLAPPEVRARTRGMVAWRPEAA
ncbi:MAG: MerR family transcriptional regulator [Phenylobacterium sp.]|uniref:MerR family transcriptional regulator n=1 Tax=Phenylobacterium sp. TaxID=1871053 RepID=UPI003919F616